MSFQTGEIVEILNNRVSVPTGRNVLSDLVNDPDEGGCEFQFLPAGMSFQTHQKLF